MSTRTITTFGISALLSLVGCDEQRGATAASEATSSSDPALLSPSDDALEHHRRYGSCTFADCGGQASNGNCWCDDLCEHYGDCCTNKSDVCDREQCGGLAGLTCSDHTECLDDPNDNCDPQNGGSDCLGFCAGFCGGIADFQCDPGYVCTDDPNDDCDPQNGGADCAGICVAAADCDPYPIPLLPDPSAQSAAEAELSNLAPGASLTWNSERGTFQSLADLDLVLTGCTGSESVIDQLGPIIESHPALFQMNLDEWTPSISPTCDSVEAQARILRLDRTSLAGQTVLADFLTFRAVRNAQDQVFIRSAFGGYLPVSSSLEDDFGACESVDAEAARSIALARTYDFQVFNQCVPVSTGTYIPNPLDTVELDPDGFWTWEEDSTLGGVHLQKLIRGRLIIHPDNVTPDLLQSDTNCPAPGGSSERIFGYELTFDAVAGEIVSFTRGIGCIVC